MKTRARRTQIVARKPKSRGCYKQDYLIPTYAFASPNASGGRWLFTRILPLYCRCYLLVVHRRSRKCLDYLPPNGILSRTFTIFLDNIRSQRKARVLMLWRSLEIGMLTYIEVSLGRSITVASESRESRLVAMKHGMTTKQKPCSAAYVM